MIIACLKLYSVVDKTKITHFTTGCVITTVMSATKEKHGVHINSYNRIRGVV